MTATGTVRPLCVILSAIIAAPYGFAQVPAAPATSGPPLNIVILEGKNTVNSLPLLRSTTPVVEIRDQNDFPVEGASVVFTLPAQGPGGTFATGGNSYTTRSDARGQATSPSIIPKQAGKFAITVSAAFGNRRGEVLIPQTNSAGEYSGAAIAPQRWYKRKLVWAIAGAAVVGGIVVLATRGSSSAPVVVTPGAPVFH